MSATWLTRPIVVFSPTVKRALLFTTLLVIVLLVISPAVITPLTIDADGKINDVTVANEDERFVKLLEIGAVANIRLWTFAKPQSAPYQQTITYDFQLDDKLPLAFVKNYPVVTYVTYDLPDLVTIRANNVVVETSGGNRNR